MQDLLQLLPLVGIALLFWLLLIRPASKRQRELREMQESLSVGTEVVLTSGIYGTIRVAEESDLMVEIADGVVIRVARGAVGAQKRPDTGPADETDVPDQGEEGNE